MNKVAKIKENMKEINNIDDEINAIMYGDDYYDYVDDDFEHDYQQYIDSREYRANQLQQKKKKLVAETRRMRAEIEKQEFEKKYSELSKKYKTGSVAADKESDKDKLSRDIYAKVLARHIVKKDIKAPLNIGIFGEWGEGKSSFLKLIVKELDRLNNSDWKHISKTHVVRYNAAEYDEKNKIWASIITKLFDEFENDKGFKAKFCFGKVRFMNSLKENATKYVINFIIIIFTSFWLYFTGVNSISLNDLRSSFIGIIGIVPFIMFITNILIPFIKQQIIFIQPLSNRIISNIELPNYKQNLGFRENIKDSLNDLLKAWINKEDQKIVIIVDELDRCSCRTISEFFNALQLLLSTEGIIIILSVNYTSVCYSLADNHKYYFEGEIENKEKIKFGIDYLKKYINIPVHLPTTYSYHDYITHIFTQINNLDNNVIESYKSEYEEIDNSNKKVDNLKVFEDNEEVFINFFIEWINNYKHMTPREIKNIINILLISKEICIISNQQALYNEKINFEKYIRWFMFQYFNNKTAQNIVKKIIKNDEYNHKNIKEFLNELSETNRNNLFEEDKNMANQCIKIINEIRVEEIRSFINISNCFIYNPNF